MNTLRCVRLAIGWIATEKGKTCAGVSRATKVCAIWQFAAKRLGWGSVHQPTHRLWRCVGKSRSGPLEQNKFRRVQGERTKPTGDTDLDNLDPKSKMCAAAIITLMRRIALLASDQIDPMRYAGLPCAASDLTFLHSS